MNLSSPPPAGAEHRAAPDQDLRRALELLSGNRPRTPEFQQGLELLERQASVQDHPEAAWHLGALYLQIETLPDARENARRWLTRAAELNVVPAFDRLADLFLCGRGLQRDVRKALDLYLQLANRGISQGAWLAGYLLTQGVEGDCKPDEAVTFFARGAALGDPLALYSLGLRFMLGAGVSADPAFGRALSRLAADAGIPDAIKAADEYAPREEYGRAARVWYGSLRGNLSRARDIRRHLDPWRAVEVTNPVLLRLEEHFAGLGHPSLSLAADGRLHARPGGGAELATQPRPLHYRSHAPRVATTEGFATREECAHLITRVRPELEQPGSYRGGGHAYADLALFDGTGSPLGPMRANAVVRLLEQRITDMTQHDIEALEPCSVIRYQDGHEYRPHVDFFTEEQMSHNASEYADHGGQRLATFLLYLQAPDAGGETVYQAPGLVIRGEPGLGVLHYNVLPDGKPDQQSVHIGRPVRRGEKWLWRCALRERPLLRTAQSPGRRHE